MRPRRTVFLPSTSKIVPLILLGVLGCGGKKPVPIESTQQAQTQDDTQCLSGGSCASSASLIGHWRFDETGTATNAADATCNANNGTLREFTTPTWEAGKRNGALRFNGTSNWLKIPDASAFDSVVSTNQLTVMAWVKISTASSGFASIASRQSTEYREHWNIMLNEGKLSFGLNSYDGTGPHRCDAPSTHTCRRIRPRRGDL